MNVNIKLIKEVIPNRINRSILLNKMPNLSKIDTNNLQVDQLLIFRNTDYVSKNPLLEILNTNKVKMGFSKDKIPLIYPISHAPEANADFLLSKTIAPFCEQTPSKLDFLKRFKPFKADKTKIFAINYKNLKNMLCERLSKINDIDDVINKCKNKNGELNFEKMSLVKHIIEHKKVPTSVDINNILDYFVVGKTYDLKLLQAGKSLLSDYKIEDISQVCNPMRKIINKSNKFSKKQFKTYMKIISGAIVDDGLQAKKLHEFCYDPLGKFEPKVAKFILKSVNSNKFETAEQCINLLEACKGYRNSMDFELLENAEHLLKNPKITSAKNIINPIGYLKRYIKNGGGGIEAMEQIDKLLKCDAIKNGKNMSDVLLNCLSKEEHILDMNLLKIATNTIDQNYYSKPFTNLPTLKGEKQAINLHQENKVSNFTQIDNSLPNSDKVENEDFTDPTKIRLFPYSSPHLLTINDLTQILTNIKNKQFFKYNVEDSTFSNVSKN